MKYVKMTVMVMAFAVSVLAVSACSAAKTTGAAEEAGETTDLLSAVKASGVLKVGVEDTFPPYTYHDDRDKLVGYDVEVATEVAKKLGLEIQFTETKWDSLIAGLDVNHYDIIFSDVAITEERLEKYEFSIPYAFTRASVIVRSDNDDISTFEDLNGRKSAQTITSNYAVQAEAAGAEIVGTAGFSESVELVLNSVVDATVNSNVSYYYYMMQQPDADLKLAAEYKEAVIRTGAIFNQGSPEFKAEIDKALTELNNEGILTELSIKYFGSDISQE